MEPVNQRLLLVSQALDQTGMILAGITEEQLHHATAEQVSALARTFLPASARGAGQGFGEEVAVDSLAPTYARLAGFLGRQP
jgi:hypothetical protein